MIVITTPTGTIGHQVLENVLDSGEPIRVIARDPSRLPAHTRERVEVVQGSHGDIDVVNQGVRGRRLRVLAGAPGPPRRERRGRLRGLHPAGVRRLQEPGVKRVVGVSALGRGAPGTNAGLVSASLAMDDLIASTGVSYRALTMPSFMDNILRQVEAIKSQGMFFSPISGDRKLPTCATRDIAAVAARLLLDHSWSGQDSVPVLGPEDLSHNDMAQIMSEVLGEAGALPADPRRGLQGQADRIRDVRRHGAGHARHDGGQERRASTTPSRAPRSPPPPPASASGARKCSSRPSWPERPGIRARRVRYG